MALEIERKFLVHNNLLPELKDGVEIIQGYLSENPSIRFRIIDSKLIIGIKEYHSDGSRFELETPTKDLTVEEIEKLKEMAICPPITKIRYKIQAKRLLWEIDVYQEENQGLITVDVELPSMDYKIDFPLWVDKSKEITRDKKYTNLNLGRKPFRKWSNQ